MPLLLYLLNLSLLSDPLLRGNLFELLGSVIKVCYCKVLIYSPQIIYVYIVPPVTPHVSAIPRQASLEQQDGEFGAVPPLQGEALELQELEADSKECDHRLCMCLCEWLVDVGGGVGDRLT